MKWKIHRIVVDQALRNTRLDQYLAAAVSELSRTQARKLIDIGGVHLNGRRVRSCSLQVQTGDRVEIYIDHYPLTPYRISAEDILFEDKYLIVLNKSAQLDTQPTHARYKGTLYEALQDYLKNPLRPDLKPNIGMIQRLDRGTSGIIVFSIHQRANKEMTAIFLEHRVDKRYLALVIAAPEDDRGEICSLLARSRRDNRVRSVSSGGKEAITRYRVVERYEGAALVELELLTGRTHQIRAHMAELGCPLLGDTRYGGPDTIDGVTIERPLLHACSLAFKHPVEGQNLKFTLPLPEDMQSLTARLV